MEPQREREHRRNLRLEQLLSQLNEALEIGEAQAIQKFTRPQHPVLLVVGCARSGSTLFSQWLANLGIFAVPSNLLSRFYGAPYIGAMIQKMLTDPDYAFQDELVEFQPALQDYTSRLGKTSGVLSPHNFLYFWRQFFRFGEIQRLSQDELAQVDRQRFLAELAAMEAVFEKPLAMKAMIMNWNLSYLQQIFPRFLFIHLERNPLLNAQSLLRARQEFFGSLESWYSYKPPEYPTLKDLTPYEQVAGQVFFTNQAISKQLKGLERKNWLHMEYSAFCDQPERAYREIAAQLNTLGFEAPQDYAGPDRFAESKQVMLREDEVRQILDATQRHENTETC